MCQPDRVLQKAHEASLIRPAQTLWIIDDYRLYEQTVRSADHEKRAMNGRPAKSEVVLIMGERV